MREYPDYWTTAYQTSSMTMPVYQEEVSSQTVLELVTSTKGQNLAIKAFYNFIITEQIVDRMFQASTY